MTYDYEEKGPALKYHGTLSLHLQMVSNASWHVNEFL